MPTNKLRIIGILLLIAGLSIIALFFAGLLTGFFEIGIGLAIVGLVLVLLRFPNPTVDWLGQQRKIKEELQNAEKKFLAREMTEEAFKAFSFSKQKELVDVESKLASARLQVPTEKSEELSAVSANKKHILRVLLEKKQALQAQLQIAEQKYLNRELAEKDFFALQQSSQVRLLEIDAEIKSLCTDASVETVLAELQKELNENARKRSRSGSRESAADEMASDLLDQTNP